MIFWNLPELEARLANNQLSEKETLNYLIGNLILSTAFAYIHLDDYFGWEIVTELILGVSILIYGTRKCFLINKSIDGQFFLERFLSLMFVVTIRFIVYIILFIIILIIVLIWFLMDDYLYEDLPEWLYSLIAVLIQGLFFWVLVRAFERIREMKKV